MSAVPGPDVFDPVVGTFVRHAQGGPIGEVVLRPVRFKPRRDPHVWVAWPACGPYDAAVVGYPLALAARDLRPVAGPEALVYDVRANGVALELHAAHLAPLLAVVRAEKERHNARRDRDRQRRADTFREIEHRLQNAQYAWEDANRVGGR